MTTTTVKALTADGVIQSWGVNVKLDFFDTSYANAQAVLNSMEYIGLDSARDLLPATDTTSQAPYTLFANSGIKFDFVVTPVGGAMSLSQTMAELHFFESQHPGALAAVEGSNEVNIWPVTYDGLTGMAAAAAWQKDLYNAVHADTTLAGISVYALTLGGGTPDQYAALGNLSAYADDGNAHIYPGNGVAPGSFLLGSQSYLAYSGQDTPGRPTVLTEFGYYDMNNPDYDGVNQDVQAKYILDGLLDAVKAGVPMTYLYQLVDGAADPGQTNREDHYGLFNYDFTPKPAATDLHNLTSILHDSSNQNFSAGSLAYSVSTGNSLLMEKSNGAFDLAVWAEPQIWDPTTETEITVPATPDTITLGSTFASVTVFDPTLGTGAVESFSNVSQFSVSLTDHPLIIQLIANPPSPNGANISSASAAPIIDQAGNAWTLVRSASQGLQIAVNGIVDASTGWVTLLGILGGDIVQKNIAGNWYSEPGPSGPWSPISAPTMPVTTGSGSDTVVLSISEDAWANSDSTSDANGDAAFTVAVDGKELAGTFYATALHSAGASQNFIFKGDWAPGTHTVTVSFLNDAWGGTASTDRNLYVNDVTYDKTDTKESAALYSGGSKGFTVTDSTAIPPVVTGSGSDSLVLKVSEDYYLANAQFTVSVDGKQLGGKFTATTLHSSGNSQTFAFAGDFGSGQHTVSVDFLNDAYAGTPSTDRNLYVNDIVYNGIDTGQSAALMSTGAKTFSVSGGTTPSVSEISDHGSLQENLSQTGTYTVGGDTFALSSGNASSVTLGTGISEITFIGASSVTLTGGSGEDIVTADAGSNRFVAGTGTLEVTGGGGKDSYFFHTTSGLLTIDDFSLAKGDTLTLDKALQGSLSQASDGQGGTMLTFGSGVSHGIDIHGLALLPNADILWA